MASTWCWEQSSVLSVTGNELVFTFSSHGSSPQCHTQHDPAAQVTRERSLWELTGVIELVTISLGLVFLLVPRLSPSMDKAIVLCSGEAVFRGNPWELHQAVPAPP